MPAQREREKDKMVREREVSLCKVQLIYSFIFFCVCMFFFCLLSLQGKHCPILFLLFSPIFSPPSHSLTHYLSLFLSPPPLTNILSLSLLYLTHSFRLSQCSFTYTQETVSNTHTHSLSLSLSLLNTHAQTDLSGLQSCRRDQNFSQQRKRQKQTKRVKLKFSKEKETKTKEDRKTWFAN